MRWSTFCRKGKAAILARLLPLLRFSSIHCSTTAPPRHPTTSTPPHPTLQVHWIFKNKDHGKMSATASLGTVLLWDVEGGLPQIDRFLYSTDNQVGGCGEWGWCSRWAAIEGHGQKDCSDIEGVYCKP